MPLHLAAPQRSSATSWVTLHGLTVIPLEDILMFLHMVLPSMSLPSDLQLAFLRDKRNAGHSVSSNHPELDLRALQAVCAAAISALAESMHKGEVEDHIAEAVVRMGCAAAEREPEACTSSSQQVHLCAMAVCLK